MNANKGPDRNLIQQFKKVFTSTTNAQYLMDLVKRKLSALQPDLDVSLYKNTLLQLQNIVFDTHLPQLLSELDQNGQLNLEEYLIQLNKITIDNLEHIIVANHNGNTHQPQSQSQSQSQPQSQSQSQPQSQSQQQSQPQRHNKSRDNEQTRTKEIVTEHIQEIGHDKENEVCIKYHHFFSSDSALEHGRYTFPINIQNIKSANLLSVKVNCNIYNITESNNKINAYEQNNKIPIAIPIGYYKLDDLLLTLSDALSANSVNKNIYQVTHNRIKNKIHLKCISTSQRPCQFTLQFVNTTLPNQHSSHFSIKDILGFTKDEYTNNNMYVSEKHPIDNVLDDLYLKVFLNNKELPRFTSSKQSFSYFETFHIDLNTNFGKTVNITNVLKDPFDIIEDLDVNEIGFELWNSPNHVLTRYINFELVFCIEY